MSDLAERIRAVASMNPASVPDAAAVFLFNADEILAALEERDKLRAALFYARDTLFVLPGVFMDDLELRIKKAIAMADAALQPTPETKEK